MSFLTEIENFAYEAARKVKNTVAEFVSGEDSNTSKAEKKPNSIISQSNIGTNTDEFVSSKNMQKTGSAAQQTKQKQFSPETENARITAFNKCLTVGADYATIVQILKSKGIDIEALSNEEKIKHYNSISKNVEYVLEMKQKGLFTDKKDVNAWIAFGTKLNAELSTIKVSKHYSKEIKKYSEQYTKDILFAANPMIAMAISAKTHDQITDDYAKYIDDVLGINDNWFEKAGKKVLGFFFGEKTDAEKEAEVRSLQKERDLLLEDMELRSYAAVDDNEKLQAIARLGASERLGDNLRMAGETILGKEAKTSFYDSVSVANINSIVDSYNQSYSNNPNHILFGKRGAGMSLDEMSDPNFRCTAYSCPLGGSNGTNSVNGGIKVTSESVGDAVAVVSAGKSQEGLKSFENDLVKLRKSVEQSNDDYKKEITRAMHSAVGAGALLNTNLTEEQKTEFLNNWNNDAKIFSSSYDQVVSGCKSIIQKYIQKYGQGNPELVRHLEKLERKLDEIIARKNREDNIKHQEEKELERKISAEKKKIEAANKQAEAVNKQKETQEYNKTVAKSERATNPIVAERKQGTSKAIGHRSANSGAANCNQAFNSDYSFANNTVALQKVEEQILKNGYNSVKSVKARLQITLHSSVLWQLYSESTYKDLEAIQSVEEACNILNGCSTSVKTDAVQHVNKRIKEELIERLKKDSSTDFAIIVDSWDNNKDKDNVEERENAAA